MNEDLKPTPSTPTQQPVSMHGESSRHSAWPFIAAMLGVFLVLETIALVYIVSLYSGVQNVKDNVQGRLQERADKVDDLKTSLVPFLYTKSGREETSSFSHLIRVNRQNGQESTLFEAENNQFVSIIAIPQIGFDGRVFLRIGCSECDNPYLDLYEYDVDGKSEPVALKIGDGSLFSDAVAISPDKTRLAIAQYESVVENNAGEILVYDLLTGETEVVGELAEDEYFSRFHGPNTFAGAGDFELVWKDRECFNVTIYEDTATPLAYNEKRYKETRTYCAGDGQE